MELSPRPGSAPASRRVMRQAGYETRAILRNPEQLLLAFVIPIALLLVLTLTSIISIAEPRVATVVPGILTLAVMSTAFTSLAVSTGFDRRYGALTLLGTTPLSRAQLLAAKIIAVLLVEVIQCVLVSAIGAALGWRPGLGAFSALVFVILGTIAFASWALLLAGTLRAEATLAVANGIYLLLLLGGGTLLALPGTIGSILQFLPSAALGTGLRGALIDGGFGWAPAAILVAWGAVGSALTARFFRWQ